MTLRSNQAGRLASPLPRPPDWRLANWCLLAALSALLWLGAACLYSATRPGFGPTTLLLPGEAPRTCAYPFHLQDAPKAKFVLIQQMELPRFHPSIFVLYPRDFLWAVSVNGHEIHPPGLPLAAASHEGRSIDLAPFLHPGGNTIALQMEVRWREASFRLAVSPWDWDYLGLLALVVGATCVTVAFMATYLKTDLLRLGPMLLMVGIVLRYIYWLGTPYYVRSFDYWGHAEYLDYVTRHCCLPPPNANWEAFQPPLYYMLVAGLTKLLLFLGMTEDQRYVLWQGISLLLSMGVLAAGYGIASLLYKEGDRCRFYMIAVFAVAPPLVFNAARVSNDGLLALLSYAWLALLLCYWRRPHRAVLVGMAIALGLALLTKANAVSLVFVTAACLLCDRRFEAKSRIASLGVVLVVCTAIAGWYYLPRALHAGEVDTMSWEICTHSVPARALMTSGSRVSSLNPFKVVRYPFDEIWGPRDDYFLEVFFKTMLLGEWIKGAAYKFLARWMVLVALLLVPPFVVGLWRAVRRLALEEEPLLATFVGVFLAQWLFLQFAPYLSTQDFRFSVILFVPMTYFLLRNVSTSSYYAKAVATFLLQLALLNSAIYLLVPLHIECCLSERIRNNGEINVKKGVHSFCPWPTHQYAKGEIMFRITLLVAIAALVLGGWAWAREQEILNHPRDAQMQEMQDASCDPSSDPSGAG